MLGKNTSLRAIALASIAATLLAPFLTGVVLGVSLGWPKPMAGVIWSGPLAFLVAISTMPMQMTVVGVTLALCGCLACECERWAVPILVVGTSLIGIGTVLFGMETILRLEEPGTPRFLMGFLLAGALTGLVYAGLIASCDRLLRRCAE